MDRNPSHRNVLAVLFDCEEQFTLSSTISNSGAGYTQVRFSLSLQKGEKCGRYIICKWRI